MSLSHLISLVDALNEPRNAGYDFGLGMHPRQLQMRPTSQSLLSPWQCMHPACPTSPANKMANRRGRDMVKQSNGPAEPWRWPVAQVGKDGFQVSMDVTHFSPSELTVKVVENCVVVVGEHEEREDDHGYIARHFVRRYALPQGYEGDKVMSSLSSDGVLTISVPKPQPHHKSKERVIQIQQVGPAHLNIKHNAMEHNGEESKPKVTNGSTKAAAK